MLKYIQLNFKDSQFHLIGKLDFFNLMDIYQKSLLIFRSDQQINIDCSQLIAADSSVLALFVEWKKWARINHKSIKFLSLPEETKSLAKLAEIGALLELEE